MDTSHNVLSFARCGLIKLICRLDCGRFRLCCLRRLDQSRDETFLTVFPVDAHLATDQRSVDFFHGAILHSLVEFGVEVAGELGALVPMRQRFERFLRCACFLRREALLQS